MIQTIISLTAAAALGTILLSTYIQWLYKYWECGIIYFRVKEVFRGGSHLLFFSIIISSICHATMDKERLKLIVRNLKLLVDSLESEIYSDVDAYKVSSVSSKPYSNGDDDDGYPD